MSSVLTCIYYIFLYSTGKNKANMSISSDPEFFCSLLLMLLSFCHIFHLPAAKYSVKFLSNTLVSPSPNILFSTIHYFSAPLSNYSAILVFNVLRSPWYPDILLSNILISSCQIFWCRPLKYSDILLSSMLISSCQISWYPPVKCSDILLSNISCHIFWYPPVQYPDILLSNIRYPPVQYPDILLSNLLSNILTSASHRVLFITLFYLFSVCEVS